MKTMTINHAGHVFRWRGGSFIAMWKQSTAHLHCPDDMIKLPASLNRSQATLQDIKTIVHRHMEPGTGEPKWKVRGFKSRAAMKDFEARSDFPGWDAL